MTGRDDDWGPWIEHDSAGVPPVVLGRHIGFQSRCYDGEINEGEVFVPARMPDDEQRHWIGGGFFEGFYYRPVVRYRIRRDRAAEQGVERLRNLIADPDAPAPVPGQLVEVGA